MSPSNENPELAEYPGRSPAFGRIMRNWGMSAEGNKQVHYMESQVSDIIQVSDEELVILHSLHVRDIGIEAEVARRDGVAAIRHEAALRENLDAVNKNTAALVDFKTESATSSNRLETLTKGLIVFTAAVVLLTVVLAVHDLTH